MVARLHRDRSRRLEESAAWFKKALEHTRPASGTALLVARELVELYAFELNAGKRAAPVLARLAEERPDTPEGRWAVEELRRVKEGSGPSVAGVGGRAAELPRRPRASADSSP